VKAESPFVVGQHARPISLTASDSSLSLGCWQPARAGGSLPRRRGASQRGKHPPVGRHADGFVAGQPGEIAKRPRGGRGSRDSQNRKRLPQLRPESHSGPEREAPGEVGGRGASLPFPSLLFSSGLISLALQPPLRPQRSRSTTRRGPRSLRKGFLVSVRDKTLSLLVAACLACVLHHSAPVVHRASTAV